MLGEMFLEEIQPTEEELVVSCVTVKSGADGEVPSEMILLAFKLKRHLW